MKKEPIANDSYNKDAKPRSSILKSSCKFNGSLYSVLQYSIFIRLLYMKLSAPNVKGTAEPAISPEPKPVAGTTRYSDEEEDDSEEEDSLGKVVTKLGKEIDRKSAGNVKRSKDEIAGDEEPENEFGYTDSKLT